MKQDFGCSMKFITLRVLIVFRYEGKRMGKEKINLIYNHCNFDSAKFFPLLCHTVLRFLQIRSRDWISRVLSESNACRILVPDKLVPPSTPSRAISVSGSMIVFFFCCNRFAFISAIFSMDSVSASDEAD
jgi:hypothetical protein